MKAGRTTIQAVYDLTKVDHELSSRTCRSLDDSALDESVSERGAHLKKEEEEARQREWEARYMMPVADFFGFRRASTRLAAAKNFLETGASHVCCCLTDSDREYLAQVMSNDSSAFVTQGIIAFLLVPTNYVTKLSLDRYQGRLTQFGPVCFPLP